MRSIALSSAGGGAMLRAANVCRSGQQVDQELDQRARIAGDVAAIGQDLPLQLVRELFSRHCGSARLVGKAQRRVAQRDQHLSFGTPSGC
jgi:hypothetical protein